MNNVSSTVSENTLLMNPTLSGKYRVINVTNVNKAETLKIRLITVKSNTLRHVILKKLNVLRLTTNVLKENPLARIHTINQILDTVPIVNAWYGKKEVLSFKLNKPVKPGSIKKLMAKIPNIKLKSY